MQRESDLLRLSRVWLQTELDETKSYHQLIIQVTISENRRIAKIWTNETDKDWKRKRKLLVIKTTVVIGWLKLQLWMWLANWTVHQQTVQ